MSVNFNVCLQTENQAKINYSRKDAKALRGRKDEGKWTVEVGREEESENAIISKPISGEANLRWKEDVLVFSGEPLADLSKAVEKHREERIKGHGS